MKKKKFGVPDILLLALSLFMALGAAFLFKHTQRLGLDGEDYYSVCSMKPEVFI